MAITKTTNDGVQELFVGRVMTVAQTVETRNWSDTMDYSDFRSTWCTYALVWLGTHNLPPNNNHRPMIHYGAINYTNDNVPEYLANEGRDLEFFEQFAWIDCTNLFADRMSYTLKASEDANGGDPLMWANYIAWQAYTKALVEKTTREEEEKRAAQEKEQSERIGKEMARAKAKADKSETSRIATEARLSLLPEKGTTLTVGGFTGVVFWKGATKYRGKWSARLGLKNSAGMVSWVDESALTV